MQAYITLKNYWAVYQIKHILFYFEESKLYFQIANDKENKKLSLYSLKHMLDIL